LLEDQRQRERLKAAEAEDEIARRRALASSGGFQRSLLSGPPTGIPTGPAQNLGG
jgi:hypothetical protein